MSDLIAEAVERSADLLAEAATPWGFIASPDFDHYAVIWARDALISCLGALRYGDSGLTECAAATIDTLTQHASARGQIPALVNPSLGSWDFGEGGVVDTSAWLAVAVAEYLAITGDLERTRGWWPAVRDAVEWLDHQDVTGTGLISAAPSTDWMDAALTRSGRTLHLNVLYAWAVRSAERIADALNEPFDGSADDVAASVDAWFWPSGSDTFAALHPHGFAHSAQASEYRRLAATERTHYVSHIVHAAFVDRVDVLANCLAIVSGMAPAERAGPILDTVAAASVPWSSRSFTDQIPPSDGSGMFIEAIDAVIDRRWSNAAGRYHNGAAWPYLGGFHAAAVSTSRGPAAAVPVLERAAQANALGAWRFSEWIGPSGPDGAGRQTWNAGTFLYAWSTLQD